MLNDENSVLNQINSDSYSDNKLQPEANSSVAHKVISNKLWSSPADASVIATQLEPSGQCQLSEVKRRKPLSTVNNDSSSVAIVLNSSNVSPQRSTRLVEHLAESKQKCMFCRKSKYVKCTNTREPLMLATAHCYQEAVNQLDDQHGRNAVEMYYHKTCHWNNTNVQCCNILCFQSISFKVSRYNLKGLCALFKKLIVMLYITADAVISG